MLKQLSTLDKLHDEVDAISLLEDVIHTDNERVVDLIQNELLDFERFDRLVLNDDILTNDLHCIEFILPRAPDEIDFAESASANDANQLEVVPGHLCHCATPVK